MATVSEILGILKLKGGDQFAREMKSRLGQVKASFMDINKAITGAGVVLFFKQVNDAANSLSRANRQLAATSKLTGIDLGNLSGIAKAAESNFKLSTEQANQFTIALSKLTNKAGDVNKTGDAIGRLLDLAAAQGLDAEQALMAINQAILGIDEGTDKLFQKNPSAIYEEFAKQIGISAGKLSDQQKAQALLNAVMTDGVKVQGEYRNFLNDAPGKQAQFNTTIQRTSATLGQMAQRVLTPFLEMLTNAVEWFNRASTATQNFVVALGAVTTAAYLFGGALRALLPMIGPAGWVLLALGVLAGLFFTLQGKTQGAAEKLAQFRTGLNLLSIDEAEAKLSDLQKRLERFQDLTKNLSAGSVPSVMTGRIKATQDEIKALEEFIEKKKQAALPAATVGTGSSKEEIEKAKELLDNQREFEFEHQQLSRAQYIAHLENRLTDFKQFSDEWVSLQNEIIKQQKTQDEEQILQAKTSSDEFKKARFTAIKDLVVLHEEAGQQAMKVSKQLAKELQAELETQRQQVTDIAMSIRDAVASIGLAIGESVRANGDVFKAFWKAMLTTALDAIEKYLILAKIKSIIEAAINPFSALKNIAPLVIAAGLIQVAKGQIAALAEGTVATKPTLAVVGESRRDQFEVVAPQRKFDQFTDQLVERALARGGRGQRSVVINNHFASPLNDRRTAVRLTDEVLKPELRKDFRRDERKLANRVIK